MKRILLIEPNRMLASIYTQLFTDSGYEVIHVTGAQAAIDAADEATPGAVVLELQLPKHSGIEFLHEFRSYPEWSNLPIVINSMIPPNRLAGLRQALEQDFGVSAILYKPKASLDVLRQTIQALAIP